jgi:lipopolysaccharide transport system ATP-binding protein
MTKDWTVRVDGLWRKFGTSAQGALKYGLVDMARRLVGGTKDSARLRNGEFWALQDVCFELCRGEALGIMGVNGSGKTTLLRILNGTYSPDKGTVSLRGRVGSLIAAGAGFSPLLSGRENIHINGLLLGLTSEEIRRRFDDIVGFAGLEDFIDMPVRNYSSGMAVRLGFSIATNTTPDVLLVDEVLAVGDLAFQKRCFDRLLQIRKEGSTIILVSHSVASIWAMCDSGLFLNRGVPSGKVSVEEVGRLYDLQNFRDAARSSKAGQAGARETDGAGPEAQLAALAREHGVGSSGGTGDVLIDKVRVCDASTWRDRLEFDLGEPIGLEMEAYIANPLSDVIFRYTIDGASYRFICNLDSSYDNGPGLVDLKPGRYTVRTVIGAPRFSPGSFDVNANVCQKSFEGHLYFRHKAASFVIRPPKERFFYDLVSPAVVHFDAQFEIAESLPAAPGAKLLQSCDERGDR